MLADGAWDAEEMRHAARALLLLAAYTRNATVAAWAAAEAGWLQERCKGGTTVMVLPVAAEVRPVCWPRLEDGGNG